MQLEDYSRGRKAEMSQLMGQDALDIFPLYQNDFEKKATDISGKLSEGAKARFNQLALSTRKTHLDSVATHVATQVKAYTKDSRDAWLGSRIKAMAENPLSFDAELQKGNAVIDATTPGPEGVLKKDEFYKKARSEQLDSMMFADLNATDKYLEENRKVVGEDIYQEYKEKVTKKIEQARKDTIATNDKKEKEAEKQKKKEVDESDYNTLLEFRADKIPFAEITNRADRRQISPELYDKIYKEYHGELAKPQKNNPLVLGSLTERMVIGQDIREDVKKHWLAGGITDETYTTLIGKVADKDFKLGQEILRIKMEPGPFERRILSDANMRYGEALERYIGLVGKGEKPTEAAKGIVDSYKSDQMRSIQGLPRPQFLSGKKDDFNDLQEAERLTVEAYRKGKLDINEFNYQINVITELKRVSMSFEDIFKDGSKTDKRLEKTIKENK